VSTDRSFRVPTSTAMAGKEGWTSSGESVFNLLTPIKTGKPVVVRFLTNPLDPSRDQDEDWVFYREIGAWDGLLGGIKMKGGCMTFPVYDVVYYEDGTRTSAPRGTDLLFESVLPSERDIKKGYNRAQASDMLAFNAIVVSGDFGAKKEEFNPKPGQHIIIKLTGQKGRGLLEQLESKSEEFDDFNPLDGAWQLNITGTPPTTNLMLTRKTKGIEALDYTPELVNVMEHLVSIREAAEAHWEEQKLLQVTQVGMSDEDDEDDIVESFEEAVQATDYSVMSPARLKKLLADAGVEVPARATTAKLIELAKAELASS